MTVLLNGLTVTLQSTWSHYEDAKYFAYYPYQESLGSDKYDATKTTAETFAAL